MLVFELCISGILEYVLFHVWLLPLHMFVRFTFTVTCRVVSSGSAVFYSVNILHHIFFCSTEDSIWVIPVLASLVISEQ